MKYLKKMVIVFTLSFGSMVFAHPTVSQPVSLEPELTMPISAGNAPYVFQLINEKDQSLIAPVNLVETHTKILHLIVYDASLNEFQHEHPNYDGKEWTVDLNFRKNGNYFFWAQGQLTDGTEFSALSQNKIINGESALTIESLGDHRIGIDRHTCIELDKTKITAGKMAMINFKISRDDGTQPILSNYLGAFAHVIAVAPDGDEMIHVHPMQSGTNAGMLHTEFPVPGDYRVWIQLMDQDQLKTIPLSVTVVK